MMNCNEVRYHVSKIVRLPSNFFLNDVSKLNCHRSNQIATGRLPCGPQMIVLKSTEKHAARRQSLFVTEALRDDYADVGARNLIKNWRNLTFLDINPKFREEYRIVCSLLNI